MSTPTYNIVIVIPGTTGSTLVKSGSGYYPVAALWPDQVMLEAVSPAGKLINKDPGGIAAGMLEQTLYPAMVSGFFNPAKGYGSLAASIVGGLSKTGPCALVAAQAPIPGTNTATPWGLPPGPLNSHLVIGFAYDWRQDNTVSAKLLQTLLAAINTAYGSSAIGTISLIAHSMGGIVSRTYLEQVANPGNTTTDPLFGKIANLITLGTPHLGAPLAWDAAVGNLNLATYVNNLPFGPTEVSQIETMVEDFVDNTTYPSDSTFELLPPVETNLPSSLQNYAKFITYKSATGTPYSPFDVLLKSNSVPADLAAAIQGAPVNQSDFSAANSLLAPLSNGINTRQTKANYYCIYGVSSVCPTLNTITFNGGATPWTDNPVAQGGDQIVPWWSASFGSASFLAAKPYRALSAAPSATPPPPGSVNHFQLPGSPDAQSQILTWLGLSN